MSVLASRQTSSIASSFRIRFSRHRPELMRACLPPCAQSTNLLCAFSSPFARRSVSTFKVGDRVLLKRDDNPEASARLSKPLKENGKTESHRGAFADSDIIGKRTRDVIKSSSGHHARLHLPTLAQHISLTPRLVTPIYPEVAERIVSLLDIHADCNVVEENGRPLEILEAGTGHGALTLHLARAVHAANAHLKTPMRNAAEQQGVSADEAAQQTNVSNGSRERGAIIHTTDVSSEHSKHARKIVAEFRRGLYTGDVDFHVGDISSFISKQRAARGTNAPFLDAVILDLPGAHNEIETAVASIVTDGTLATFCPHITQIVDGVRRVRQRHLPLLLDQVVELNAATAGGRQWDIRLVRPRNRSSSRTTGSTDSAVGGKGLIARGRTFIRGIFGVDTTPAAPDEGLEVICRPKYGDLITAGGFLAIWKKMET